MATVYSRVPERRSKIRRSRSRSQTPEPKTSLSLVHFDVVTSMFIIYYLATEIKNQAMVLALLLFSPRITSGNEKKKY
jgi:hypothetical protein